MAVGNRHLAYKELLNDLEARAPGTKAAFVGGFFDRAHDRFADVAEGAREALRPCAECGAPTPGDVCAFCRLRAVATAVPVAAPRRRSAAP
jgi:tRNA(Ile)-lysidine synthase TilS/MesJ